MAACPPGQPCLPACLVLTGPACRATHTHTSASTSSTRKSCTLCYGWLALTACFCSGHVCPIQDNDLAVHRVVLDDQHEEQKGCGTAAASACLLQLQRGACMFGREGRRQACLPSGACRHPDPCRPACKAGRNRCPFLSLSCRLILPMKQGPVFSTYSTIPSLLTEPRRTRAGQRSSAAHARG